MTGSLHWALRTSFREYVTEIEDGRIDLAGVELDAEDRFVFAPSAGSAEVWTFDGRVDFRAHYGVLDFRLHDLRLEFGPRDAYVSVGPQAREVERVVLAELSEIEAASPDERTFAAVLTPDGVRVLGGVYSVGDALEPLTVAARRS